jgi:hypothetical protein
MIPRATPPATPAPPVTPGNPDRSRPPCRRQPCRPAVASRIAPPLWTAPGRASITRRARLTASHREPGAQVAQLVEHVTENHGVGGSIPPLGTILKSQHKL